MTNGNQILEQLEINSDKNEYIKYISKIVFEKKYSTSKNLIFSIDNVFLFKFIKTKYEKIIESLINNEEISFEITLLKNIQTKKTNTDIIKKELISDKISLLNPSFEFDNFIVGASNQFAYVTSFGAAKNPGKEFNPLILYGNVGLGKTHLLHAIGNYCDSNNVICVTAETFTSEFTNSLVNKNISKFKNKYRNCDVLLIDDIQFIGNKGGIQEEFFHTFNELHSKNIQIVLTSDKKPNEIEGLEDRLKSRFQMGIIANIKQPELETKISIIKKKCEIDNINISDEIAIYIATNLNSSIREIEGVLMKLNAYANMINQEITLEFTKNILKEHIIQNYNKINIDDILNKVANILNIKPSEIKSKSKSKKIAEARRISIFFMRNLTKTSMPILASFFSYKDHSSISHALSKIKKDIKNVENYHEKINKIQVLILK